MNHLPLFRQKAAFEHKTYRLLVVLPRKRLGSIMAEVGGKAAEEAFAVSGLVESLFGIGEDLSNFVTEPVVYKFLEATKKVLADDAWETIPEVNKNAVIQATKNLGISIEDLRTRIDVIAQLPTAGEAVEDEKSSGIDGSGIEMAIGRLQERHADIVTSSSSRIEVPSRTRVAAHAASRECGADEERSSEVEEELAELEEIPINKTSIARFSPTKLAAVLAGFIVSYDATMCEEFREMKGCLTALFQRKLIGGAVLVMGNEEVVKKRLVDIVDALSEGAEEGKRESLIVFLELLMSFMNEDDGRNTQ